MCCHGLYEFISATVLGCLEGLVSLVPSIPVGSYNHSLSSPVEFPESIIAVTLTAKAALELRVRQDPPIMLEMAFID